MMLKSVLFVTLGAITLVGVDGVMFADTARADGGPGMAPVHIMELPVRHAASTALAQVEAPALSSAAQQALAAGMTLCANAHVQGIGWQGWACTSSGNLVTVGTMGQSLRMEALAVVTSGAGGICAMAYVQNSGWQGIACGLDGEVVAVGTTGQSLRMEALAVETTGTRGICADAYVQNIGWQGELCASDAVVVGTTGQSLRMEAVALTVP
jgi:hypothetical protein